jgi:hypothetical protein
MQSPISAPTPSLWLTADRAVAEKDGKFVVVRRGSTVRVRQRASDFLLLS